MSNGSVESVLLLANARFLSYTRARNEFLLSGASGRTKTLSQILLLRSRRFLLANVRFFKLFVADLTALRSLDLIVILKLTDIFCGVQFDVMSKSTRYK
jgi:hypothetical protein